MLLQNQRSPEARSTSVVISLSPPEAVFQLDQTQSVLVPARSVIEPTNAVPWMLTIKSNFRVNVIARDGTCLLTDVPHQKCTAAHIVPYSRPDVSRIAIELPRECISREGD